MRSLLEFAGGRAPNVNMVDPVKRTQEIVEFFRETSDQIGIKIVFDSTPGTQPAPPDRESIHACLANLITNALDACQTSDKLDCQIMVRCFNKDNCLIFEVQDEGYGMA